jgi:O-methyltransferase involved in polyketide biosynthesis
MGDTTTLRNISDTALWVAWYRALESERADAWFLDPLARRLAGTRGERIAQDMAFANRHAGCSASVSSATQAIAASRRHAR